MVTLLTPSQYRRTPWKNGGGETTEIVVRPRHPDLDALAWRVSIADIRGDGPFSVFPGIDRSIALLDGDGMSVTGADVEFRLVCRYDRAQFSGDTSVHCTLLGGPCRDFNLMVRRSIAEGRLLVVRGKTAVLPPAHAYLCFMAEGSADVMSGDVTQASLPVTCSLLIEGNHDEMISGVSVRPRTDDAVMLVAVILRVDPSHNARSVA